MNAQDKIAEPRVGNGSLVRPRFTSGQMLQDDDLTQAVDYSRDLNRLLFRSLLGCGVICGLVVSREEKCGRLYVGVAPGLALDCCGEAIQVCSAQTFVLDPTCKGFTSPLCVVLRYRERSCSPRSPSCGQDDDASCVSTRINEGYELRIISGDCPDCGCGCATLVQAPAPAPAPSPTPTPTPESLTISKPAAKKPKDASAITPATPAATTPTPAPSPAPTPAPAPAPDCSCADPTRACYADHYAAVCSCCTDCEWVTLARLIQVQLPNATTKTWEVDHSVRRLIRPVLMRDTQAQKDVDHIQTGT